MFNAYNCYFIYSGENQFSMTPLPLLTLEFFFSSLSTKKYVDSGNYLVCLPLQSLDILSAPEVNMTEDLPEDPAIIRVYCMPAPTKTVLP